MATKTISKLVAKIGFNIDLTGLKSFRHTMIEQKKVLGRATKAITLTTIALTKFIEVKGREATQIQLQSAYYNIQLAQLTGLSIAYKNLGGNISTHLQALKAFQGAQAGLLTGQINAKGIRALAISGSSSLIQTLLYGSLQEFETGVGKRYALLSHSQSKYDQRRAALLRASFGTYIQDYNQQQVLLKVTGLTPKGAAAQSNLALYGTSNSKQIAQIQLQLQKFSYSVGLIGTAIDGVLIKVALGFSHVFSTAQLKSFEQTLINLGPIAVQFGQALGTVFITAAKIIQTTVMGVEDFFGWIKIHVPIIIPIIKGLAIALGAMIAVSTLARLGLFISRLSGLTFALKALKTVAIGESVASSATGALAAVGAVALPLAAVAVGALIPNSTGNGELKKHTSLYHNLKEKNAILDANQSKYGGGLTHQSSISHSTVNHAPVTHSNTHGDIHVHVAGSQASAHEIGAAVNHHLTTGYNTTQMVRAN